MSYLWTYAPRVAAAGLLGRAVRLAERVSRRLDPRRPCVCPLCERAFAQYAPLDPSFGRTLRAVKCVLPAFDVETLSPDSYMCPACGGSDRARLCALYLRQLAAADPGVFRHQRILHIAPDPGLPDFCRRHLQPLEFRTADLGMAGVDDRIDLQSMTGYADARWDVFICMHVLEHVPDDRRAMAELRRILAPSGFGICMVPIHLSLAAVIEDPRAVDPETRWKYHGQDDHLRAYSKPGFLQRLKGAGFQVSEYGVADVGAAAFALAGLEPSAVLYVVRASAKHGPAGTGGAR